MVEIGAVELPAALDADSGTEVGLVGDVVFVDEGREELCGYVFPGYMYEGLSSTFLQNLWSNGGDVIDSEGRVILDSEPAREAAQYMYDLVHRHKITPPQITGAEWGYITSSCSAAINQITAAAMAGRSCLSPSANGTARPHSKWTRVVSS